MHFNTFAYLNNLKTLIVYCMFFFRVKIHVFSFKILFSDIVLIPEYTIISDVRRLILFSRIILMFYESIVIYSGSYVFKILYIMYTN